MTFEWKSLEFYQHKCLTLKALLSVLLEQNPDDLGDLYLDVAEAYMVTGNYAEAVPLLDLLVNSTKFSMVCTIFFISS